MGQIVIGHHQPAWKNPEASFHHAHMAVEDQDIDPGILEHHLGGRQIGEIVCAQELFHMGFPGIKTAFDCHKAFPRSLTRLPGSPKWRERTEAASRYEHESA